MSGHTPRVAIGVLLLFLGACLGGAGMWAFIRASTVIFPHDPASVTTGPYAISRNPMYSGLALLHAGSGIVLGSLWPLILLPVVLWTVYRMVVRREEAYLSAKFGDAYALYRQRVRRWL